MERIPHPSDAAICNWLWQHPTQATQESILTVAGSFMDVIRRGTKICVNDIRALAVRDDVKYWYIEGEWSDAPTSKEDEMQYGKCLTAHHETWWDQLRGCLLSTPNDGTR